MIETATIQPLHTAEQIAERVAGLARRLDAELRAEDPILVSVLNGSAPFLCDLLRHLESPFRFDFMRVDYEAGGGTEPLQIHYQLPSEVRDQTLVLFKDVVSTGVIETYLLNQLRQHGARRVLFATLIDLTAERKTDFQPDYPLFSQERQGLMVGYGLTHQQRFGHLPFIGRWPEEASS